MCNVAFLLSIYVTSLYDLLEIIQNVVVQCKALGRDFVGQAESPQFHEPKFASPGEILNGT